MDYSLNLNLYLIIERDWGVTWKFGIPKFILKDVEFAYLPHGVFCVMEVREDVGAACHRVTATIDSGSSGLLLGVSSS